MDGSDGIRTVVLRRSSDGLGFSIMGGAGYEFPPVIYGIEMDSPAARSGLLEAGDIILAINEREVVKLSTKEVLKCLRLSGDIVNIKYKRDPHVVSRVRQFLSTPTHDEGDGNYYYPAPPQVTINTGSNPSSPYKTPGSGTKASKIRQPNIITRTSPTRTLPTSTPGPGGDQPDSANHISFSDDLFINHGHHQAPLHTSTPLPGINNQNQPIKSMIPVRSPTHALPTPGATTNGGKNGSTNGNRIPVPAPVVSAPQNHTPLNSATAPVRVNTPPHSAPARVSAPPANPPVAVASRIQAPQSITATPTRGPPPPPAPRKNFEAFVMTGDAILNVSKLRNDDVVRTSPVKTASKLTPLTPVAASSSAPPHQIYSARLTQPPSPAPVPPLPPPQQDQSESSEVSPPLPPPPTSNSTSSSTSDSITHVTVKSDTLPPPPPSLVMEDVSQTNNDKAIAQPLNSNNLPHNSNVKGQSNGIGATALGDAARNRLNNNEDTSISSSVMSDSAEEVDEELALDPEPVCTKENKKFSKTKPSKVSSFESETTTSEDDAPVRHERERYNEYIMFNGSRGGTIEEEDRSSGSPQAHGNEKMATPNDSEEDGAASDGDESSGTPGGHRRNMGSSGGEAVSGGDSDGSDVESMHIAPITKSVDLPSAERLARRLYTLDGFKVTNVWRQLSKPNDFCRAVATEFLNNFDFKHQTLDVSLRKFLELCPLRGETQDRERVLTYFSTRYVDCNPDFASQDAVHTLSCALMLLNTDMYSGVRDRRMTSKDFIQNLSGLNDGQDFPEPVLKKLYQSIKSQPLVSPTDTDDDESNREVLPIDPSVTMSTKEFKRGYLKRKCIFELGGKKTPLGKRSWKLYFCRLRELLLSLAPDENSKASVVQTIQPHKLHHALATVATDYRKRPYVFCLTLADKSSYLFQSSDAREMHSWIDNLNLNAAKFSSPALDAPCGSSKKFEKPLLPSAISRLSSRDQLIIHQGALIKFEEDLDELTQSTSGKRISSAKKKEAKEREAFYKTEIQRYRAFVDVLERHLNDLGATAGPSGDGPSDELIELQVLPNPPAALIEMDENGP